MKPNWDAETRKCLDFAGRLFTATVSGWPYQWRAEKWIGSTNNEHRPFLMCTAVKRLPGSKTGGLKRRMHTFHADQLPSNPDPA